MNKLFIKPTQAYSTNSIKDLKESLSDSSKIVEWFVSKCGAFDIWKECDKDEQFILPISCYRIKYS